MASNPYKPQAPMFVRDKQGLSRAQGAIRQNFADRGLRDSSMFASAMADAATRDELTNFQKLEQQRQFDAQMQSRWYEMLTAKVLQEAQLRGGFSKKLSTQYPYQPFSAGYFQNVDYNKVPRVLYPSAGSGRTGDAPSGGEKWAGFAPASGNTLQRDQLNASKAEAAARLELMRSADKREQERWDAQKAQSENKYLQAMAIIDNHRVRDEKGNVTGYDVTDPMIIYNEIRSVTGMDLGVLAQSKDANERGSARGLYAMLFPKSADKTFKYFDQSGIWSPATAQLRIKNPGEATPVSTQVTSRGQEALKSAPSTLSGIGGNWLYAPIRGSVLGRGVEKIAQAIDYFTPSGSDYATDSTRANSVYQNYIKSHPISGYTDRR